MLKAAIAALALIAAGAASAQQPLAPTPANAPAAKSLTVDSTLHELVADARTRAVIVKHMPGFAERMEMDPEVDQIFGGVSLAEMANDPHVRGLTPEALAKLGAEIAEAQKPSQS